MRAVEEHRRELHANDDPKIITGPENLPES
ncbi:hypothetical protein SAMN05216388_10121 [Halorientalis persicus]|uniref:Uncharacterized protein n=1 Tax=Halorientalis persicus TaxID=1367881 RepID=A0A1H8PCN6_9EURY|nr:hypothetical protein SAMN05216388_10121 [Halorientalis persicus]